MALGTMEWIRTTIKGVSVECTLSYVNKLCRLSYHCIYGWDGGIRTHYDGVKVRCVTIYTTSQYLIINGGKPRFL